MFEKKVAGISFYIALSLIFVMWFSHLVNWFFELDLYEFGIYPQHAKGLIGIIAAPFIHSTSDFGHILNNSVPTFILTWLLFYNYRMIAAQVFIFLYLMTGIGMWFWARESYHIGMSGVIYAITSFLVFSGFFRRNMRVAAVSLFVIFLYGSLVWGIFPTAVNISWEGHALGFFSGIILAVIYKKSPPQPQKMMYEIHEEMGIEEEDEYWREDTVVIPARTPENEQESQNKITFSYEYKENKK